MPSPLFARIIPCLDIHDGRVVKGVNFTRLTDAGDPVEIALRYADQGADELTLLDISATSQGRTATVDLVRDISRQTRLPLIVGGGIRTLSDIQRLLDAGAGKITLGSAAVEHPELIEQAAAQFGSGAIIVAIDARRVHTDSPEPYWEVLSRGGTQGTGLNTVTWSQDMAQRGAGEILLTSMDRDGTKEGFDLDLTHAVSSTVGLPVIASGGVGNLQHLADGILKGGAQAVLAASIFHFGQASIAQAKAFLAEQGIATAPLPSTDAS